MKREAVKISKTKTVDMILTKHGKCLGKRLTLSRLERESGHKLPNHTAENLLKYGFLRLVHSDGSLGWSEGAK